VEAVQENMVLLSGVDLVDATVSFHCFFFTSHTSFTLWVSLLSVYLVQL
jgi:hypothetical protein